MAEKSKIEWCDRSDWNPIRGCTRASEGCRNCYAEAIAARFSDPGQPFHGFAERTANGPRWTTKELAFHVMAAKGLDTGDKVLAHVMAARLIHALRMQAKRGKLAIVGKERGAIIWAPTDRKPHADVNLI